MKIKLETPGKYGVYGTYKNRKVIAKERVGKRLILTEFLDA